MNAFMIIKICERTAGEIESERLQLQSQLDQVAVTRNKIEQRISDMDGMIAQLRDWYPDPIGGIYWVFLDNAYTSPYVPIYAGTREIAECYKNFDPTKYSRESAKWAIDFVDNLLYLKWQEMIKDVWAVRDPFEQRLFDERDEIDRKALDVLQSGKGIG